MKKSSNNERSSVVNNCDLAAAHGTKRRAVALRGDAGAAGGVHVNGDLRQVGPQQQGVADHTNVGAKPDEGDALDRLGLMQRKQALPQQRTAKGGLIDDLPDRRQQAGGQLPALGALDAVGDRQHFALPGIGVIGAVGVPGKKHRPLKFPDAAFGTGQYGGRLGGAQRPGDKIILQIDGD